MLIEQENLGRKIEVLRKEKHETTTKLDHAVLEAMEARRQNIVMIAKQDRALQATKGLRAQLEQVMPERDEAVSSDISELPDPYMMPCYRFTPEELRNATLRFSDGVKVGRGGFGVVYKGFLWNTTVAVKMLSSTGVQGQSEFKQEVYTYFHVTFFFLLRVQNIRCSPCSVEAHSQVNNYYMENTYFAGHNPEHGETPECRDACRGMPRSPGPCIRVHAERQPRGLPGASCRSTIPVMAGEDLHHCRALLGAFVPAQ